MKEEFHGVYPSGPYKQLYGWGAINASVWLPGLCELVGINPNTYNATYGTYYSAMKGLSTSSNYHVMEQGGPQFTWFKQFNASGGGEKLWNACKQQVSWLRSTGAGHSNLAPVVRSLNVLNFADVAAESHAVHPAGGGIALFGKRYGWFICVK